MPRYNKDGRTTVNLISGLFLFFMKKLVLLSLLAGLMSSSSFAQAVTNLNGEWQFFYAKDAPTADKVEAEGFYRTDYQAQEFKSTPVPSNWAILGYEEPVYRGFKNNEASEGFYIRRFHLADAYDGKRVLLHFGGVWNSAEVWLNGTWIGRHDSGYTSFSFDVTSAIKAGEENVLAVRVRQVYSGYQTDTYDDWTLGGIYRDVTLESMPRRRWIDYVTAITDFDESYTDADLTVKAMVGDAHKNSLPGNYRSPGDPYQLLITLTDAEGNETVRRVLDIPAHISTWREVCEKIHVSKPHQWNAESPYLYQLKVELLENGIVTHTRSEKIGFREISTKDGVFRINGQPVKLRGVNRHDEWPTVGRATTREHWLKDLQLMKEANINYIRACHYQHAKGFIEMCDSIGMYVGAEASLGGAGQMIHNRSFIAPTMLRTVETVVRDLNNPSIIYWSVGNEDSLTELYLLAAKTAKGLDPTRPVLFPWNADDTLPEEIDILAPHYWTSHEYDSLAAHSKRPIITTEYVHAYGEQRFGGLEECFRSLTKHPAGAGGAVWIWADQGVCTPTKKDRKVYGSIAKDDDYLRIDGQGWDGITDSYRRPMQDYWEVKTVYCPVLPTEERIAMDKDVRIPIYNGYDFTDLNTVSIGWQLFVDGKLKDKGTTRLDGQPHTTAMLTIPTSKLGSVKAGQTPYVWLTFTNAQGQEMGRRAVEIVTKAERQMAGKKQRVTIDATTGLPQGLRPTIWHRLNDGDEIIRNRKGIDLENYTTNVKSIETATENGLTVSRSTVSYEVNDSNRFEASYICTQNADGSLTIDYSITPTVQTTYIPIVGLAMKMKSAKSLRQWFGKGPEEAYPNKQTAPVLGLWSALAVSGTRQMRWADVDDLRIYCDGYLDRDSSDSDEVRFLSHVLGRSEKGRLNYPEYRLLSGHTYQGSITIIKR